jgi:GTP cyclohydrolase II
MTTTPATEIDVNDPGFVAAHRLVAETAAGRPVALVEEGRCIMAAPIDGGPLLSDTAAISGARAGYMGLTEEPTLLRLPGADRAALTALARGEGPMPGEALPLGGGAPASAATELAKLAERLPAMTVSPVEGVPPGVLEAQVSDVLSFRRRLAATVRPVASAPVPLAAGATAQVTAFRDAAGGALSAVAVGDPRPGALVRVHSSCVTGDILGSLKCDCGAQLHLALQRIAEDGGVLIYTAQEGRGIGLANKLRAYALQDEGLDTVDANLALGYHDDERDYHAVAVVLAHLGLSHVRLMSNNPAKAAALQSAGISVDPVPLIGPVTPQNARYLATKRQRSGHRL